ncbi:uncharacterized protein LOC111053558 [Nilaparvata lugens]|uniref:uncharacterized protein LOC111053558 n=1 Tax=Nilaparvata lugens TaxID=108931 RepID=UPI00193D8A3E|nr:uncharacterized protein LOC111053558 [Nilaparvata lugens]
MKGQFSNIVENDFKKDKHMKGFETRTPRMKENSTADRKKIVGVVPSTDFKGRAVVNYWGLVIVLVSCHVSNCPVNADPLSGVSGATSGSSGGHPPAWTTRTGTSLTEQIMMRHVYEQIRSLKFAYEENINQLMRKVDTIDMKMSRHSCDYSGIESVVRKIDSLDIKVNRLEASNVHRLEELSKTIHTKGIRQELAMDGLVQKVDENHERIKQKLIFAEKRLDTINSKMQVYETSITRVESRLTDIDNDISDMTNTLDDIKSLSTIIDDKHNNTQRSMKEQLQEIKSESAGSRQQLEELSSSVKDIGSRLNDTAQTAMVRDDENVRILSADTDRDLRQQINFESRRIEDKITSMYNNLWSRFMSLETTAKHLLKIGNITRRQLREDFQSLLQSEARFAEPESQEST